MGETKHTPGPWGRRWVHASNGSSTTEAGRIVGPDGHGTIAHLVMDDVVDANARLIAAAPELLAELEVMTNLVSMAVDGLAAQELVEKARAVITKARGA